MTTDEFPKTFTALCGVGGVELYERGRLDQPVVSVSEACEPVQADVEMRSFGFVRTSAWTVDVDGWHARFARIDSPEGA